MYNKASAALPTLDYHFAEKLADVTYEIGKSLLQKKDFPMAAKWMERTVHVLNAQDLNQLSREGNELRISTIQLLAHAYFGIGDSHALDKANELITDLESDVGDMLVVLLLRLEVLLHSPAEEFDGQAYAGVIRRMIKGVDLSDASYNVIMSHIRQLETKSPSIATLVLDDFLLSRLVASPRSQWVEKALLLRVLFTTNRRDTPDATDKLATLFTNVEKKYEKILSVDATLAIQAVGNTGVIASGLG